jgi:hypothetical protein
LLYGAGYELKLPTIRTKHADTDTPNNSMCNVDWNPRAAGSTLSTAIGDYSRKHEYMHAANVISAEGIYPQIGEGDQG